jgi:glycosyltransferase involved in cell wall biosynthesis
MNILVICDRDWTHPQAGGAGMNLRRQTEYWLEWGHAVTIATVSYPGASAHEDHSPLRIYRMGTTHTVYLHIARALWRGLGRDADVVMEVVNGVPWVSRWFTRRPTAVMVHHVCQQQYDFEFAWPISSIGKALEGQVMPLLYRGLEFITVSETSKADLESLGISPDRITVVHNGADHAFEAPFDTVHRAAISGDLSFKSEHPSLVYLGRLKRYKRVDELIRLLVPLLRARPTARLRIVGDGDFRQELERLAATLGVAESVEFFGHVDEKTKMEILASSWLAVTASDVEGWSISTMEAAAVGCPTVALSTSGIRESVIDNETGFVCSDPVHFQQSCAIVLDDIDLRRRLASGAARRAEAFTWEQAAKDTLAVLERVAATAH